MCITACDGVSCSVVHPRLGAVSPFRFLGIDLLRRLLGYVQSVFLTIVTQFAKRYSKTGVTSDVRNDRGVNPRWCRSPRITILLRSGEHTVDSQGPMQKLLGRSAAELQLVRVMMTMQHHACMHACKEC